MAELVVSFESQVVETPKEARRLYRELVAAKAGGAKEARDYWGQNAYDSYPIDEALAKFAPKPQCEHHNFTTITHTRRYTDTEGIVRKYTYSYPVCIVCRSVKRRAYMARRKAAKSNTSITNP